MNGIAEATKVTAQAAEVAKANGWSVKNYRDFSHRRGLAYEADLYLSGKKVGYVECQGVGDGAVARFTGDGRDTAEVLFVQCAAQAFKGTEFEFLADEFFVEAVLEGSGC